MRGLLLLEKGSGRATKWAVGDYFLNKLSNAVRASRGVRGSGAACVKPAVGAGDVWKLAGVLSRATVTRAPKKAQLLG